MVNSNLSELEFNNGTFSEDHILWLANERLYHINTPTVVFYIIAILIGVFGNSLVIYVFRFRFKRTTANIFIVCLSTFDIITCFMLIFEVFDKRLPMYSGNYPAICKLVRCVEVFANGGASVILVGIAFDRYYKICKPFKRLSMRRVRNLIIATIIAMTFVSWPMLLFHGSEMVATNYPDISGKDCADDDDYKGSVYPGIYFIILFVFIFACIVLIVVLYSLVFSAILRWKHRIVGEDVRMMSLSESIKAPSSASSSRRKRNLSHTQIDDRPYTIANTTDFDSVANFCSNDVCDTGASELETRQNEPTKMAPCQKNADGDNDHSYSSSTGVVNKGFTDSDRNIEEEVFSDMTKTISCLTINNYTENNMSKTTISNELVIENPIKDAVREQQQQDYVINGSMSIDRRKISLKYKVKLPNFRSKFRRRGNKADVRMSATTLVFGLIGLLYVLSYIPTIVVESVNAIQPLVEENLPDSTRKIVVLANSAYFINGAFNPLIYGLFNKAFRDELILIVKGQSK